ncbi:MAG: hypothetical protein ACI4JG_05515 [Acutalibacteraceae bacterium]
MKEFIFAALPWVLCGISVAVICVRFRPSKKEKGSDSRIALGMAFGLMAAPILNSFELWENHGLGIALCPLIGMAIASLFNEKKDSDEESEE